MTKNNSGKLDQNEENNSANGSDSLDNSASTALISRDSNGSSKPNNINIIQNYFKRKNNGFLGDKSKPDESELYKDEQNNLLTLQIKYALRKMSEQYSVNNKPFKNFKHFNNNIFDYYLSNIHYSNNDKIIQEKENIIKFN